MIACCGSFAINYTAPIARIHQRVETLRDDKRFFVDFQSADDNLVFRWVREPVSSSPVPSASLNADAEHSFYQSCGICAACALQDGVLRSQHGSAGLEQVSEGSAEEGALMEAG